MYIKWDIPCPWSPLLSRDLLNCNKLVNYTSYLTTVTTIIGVSLSPTLIITMAPTWEIMVSTVCTIYPAMFVTPWFPRSVYTLKCMNYGILMWFACMSNNCQASWSREPFIICCENWQVDNYADTWAKQIGPILKQQSCSGSTKYHHACVKWVPNDRWLH